jgi:hypothetical protein
VKASVGTASQASCLDAVQPYLFLTVFLLTFAHVNDSIGSVVETSSIELLSKAYCLLLRAQLVRGELFRGESTAHDISSVLLQSLLDHFANIAVLLAKLGGDFGVMRMLHHAQKIMIDQNLQSHRYSQSDWMGFFCKACNVQQIGLPCLNRSGPGLIFAPVTLCCRHP